MQTLKDFIYFDYDKAKSIISQLSGGVKNETTKTTGNEEGLNSEIGFDIKIIKGKIGGSDKDTSSKTEKIEVFHELLDEIENSLTDNSILTDINEDFDEFNGSYNEFIETTSNWSYVKASGWSTFEDFDRFQKIMLNFNEIQRLIFASLLDENPEYVQLKTQINDIRKSLKSNKQSNSNKEMQRLKMLERSLDKKLEESADTILLEETFVDRVKTFLDTFSPQRLNFRLAPLDIFTDFQILANLKNQYLIDGSFDNVIYTYGSRPNIKLTVIGVVTSCPQKEDIRVDLNNEYIGFEDSELSETATFDKAFRNVFASFEAFEKFFFVPSFPKIAISPIAIYREIKIKNGV